MAKKTFKSTSKIMLLVALVLLFAIAPSLAHANETISVTIDGQPVIFEGQIPVIVDGRTLVPVRGVFEVLGFEVGWYAPTRTVTLTSDSYVVNMSIGSANFTLNGVRHALEVPAQIIGGSTMLPLRALLEGLGYYLDFDSTTRTVIILSDRHGTPATTTPPTSAPSIAADIGNPSAQRTNAEAFRPNNIAVSGNQFYLVKEDGNLWAWGEGRQRFVFQEGWDDGNTVGVYAYAYLGHGRTQGFISPVKIMENVVSIDAFGSIRLAVKNDGTVWFWGNDTLPLYFFALSGVDRVLSSRTGALDDIVSTPHTIRTYNRIFAEPVQLPIENVIWAGTQGRSHTVYIITSDHTLWSMSHGRAVKIAEDVAAIDDDLIVKTNGELWSLSGRNNGGRLGVSPYIGNTWERDNSLLDLDAPFRVMGNVIKASSGGDQTFALRADGTLWTWGTAEHNLVALGHENALMGQQGRAAFLPPTQILDNVADFWLIPRTGTRNLVFFTTTNGELYAFGNTNPNWAGTPPGWAEVPTPPGLFDAILPSGFYETPIRIAENVADVAVFFRGISSIDPLNVGAMTIRKNDGSVYYYHHENGLVQVMSGVGE